MMKKVFSFLLALVMIIGLFPISVVVDAATYTECPLGTVSWQMIYDNPNTYYWKHDGDYYVLTARKSSGDYYVTLYRKSELRYLEQDDDDDSSSKHEWKKPSSTYTGGKLYTKGTSQTGTLANKTYSGISDLSYQNGGAAYRIRVDFTVSNGKVTVFTVTPVVEGGGSMDEVNKKYFDDAVEGIKNQILNKTAYKDLDNMIDTVSGATCSSDLIRDAVNVILNGSALSDSGEVEVPTDKQVYVYKGTSDSAFTKKDEDYKVYVEVRVVDGNIISVQTTGIRTKDNKNITDAKNVACLNKATAGISNSASTKSWNTTTVNGVDTISGATYSSNLIKEAMRNALTSTPTTEEYSAGDSSAKVYVLVSTPTSGKNYIISNKNTSGSGYMMNSSFDGDKTSIESVTVRKDSSYSGQPYITLSNDTNALTYTGTTSSFNLANKRGTKLEGKDGVTPFQYSSSYIKHYRSEKGEWRYIYFKTDKSEVKWEKSSKTAVYFYEEQPTSYTVTWVDGNGGTVTSEVEPGGTPHYPNGEPTKNRTGSSGNYTYYRFIGWSTSSSATTGQSEDSFTINQNTTLYAKFSAITDTYTIEWREWPTEDEQGNTIEGNLLARKTGVKYGDTLTYTGETPQRESDDWYTYTFSGWYTQPYHAHGRTMEEWGIVTGNETYYPTFEATLRTYYNITWLNVDGEGTPLVVSYPEGDVPSYNGTPFKADDSYNTYTFSGWKSLNTGTIYTPSATLPRVTDNETYTAQFTAVPIVYADDGKYIDGTETVQTYGYVPYVKVQVTDGKITSVEAAADISGYNKTCLNNALNGLKEGLIGKPANVSAVDSVDTVSGATLSFSAIKAAVKKALQAENTVTWQNYNGDLLDTAKISTGTTPKYEYADPTRPDDTQYTYTFSGWTPNIIPVTGDQTYTAGYTAHQIAYTVTWKSQDGSTVLETDENVPVNTQPTYNSSAPTKANTDEYTYTFVGWAESANQTSGTPANDLPNITGDVTYYAAFSQTKNQYTVRFVDYNGQDISSKKYDYGTPAENIAIPADPTRPADTQYTYTFSGWDKTITAVTGNAVYTATYSSTTNQYTIEFVNEDGTVLQSSKWEYGATPSYTGATPTKSADTQYTYTFRDWDKAIATVTGNATYKATYSLTTNQYTIEFVNEDGTVLQSSKWEYGATPSYDGATPTKSADAQYTYTFRDWDKTIATVTGNATYKATYSSTTNQYTIEFVNEDGTVLQSSDWEYGATPSYDGATPTKSADTQYTYTFRDWDKAIAIVTGNAAYKATYSLTTNQYTIEFVNEDGTVLQSSKWEYGATPSYTGTTPTKSADTQYTYTFSGWDNTITSVTGNATYTATYTSTVNKYTVTFADENGDKISSKQYDYGTLAENIEKPADPTKEKTAEYTYTFSGWTPAVGDVTANVTYTATYTSTKNHYTVKFINDDGTVLESLDIPYGTIPSYTGTPTKSADAHYTYTFSGWDNEIVEVTDNAVYKATYTATVNKYTVTFVDEDGTTILKSATEYNYGTSADDIAKPADPTKAATAQYTYTFSGWTPTVEDVTANVTYTAVYTATVNQYTVTFVDEDGTTILKSATEYNYGTLAENIEKPADPTKAATAQYTYTFSGWTPTIEDVTENVTYTAVYISTVNQYTVTFADENGDEISSKQYDYGTSADDIAKPADPTKAATAQYTYTFSGWTPAVEDVTDNAVYKATYTATVNKYTVTFVDEDGLVLETDENVEYGTMPHYDGDTPEKENTAEYNYTFTGWTPALSEVTGDVTYTAQYGNGTNSYVITWLDGNSNKLKSETVAYGTRPVYTGTVPTKDDPDDHHCYYVFNGTWKNLSEDTVVTGSMIFTAQFDEVQRYKVTITDYTKNKVIYTNLQSGNYYLGEVKFTVRAEEVVVLGIDNGNDTYTRMYCTQLEDGSYEFTVNVTDHDVNLVVGFKGDFDLNGKVNSLDATKVSRYKVHTFKIDKAVSLFIGDIDSNGKINSLDATKISRYKVKTFKVDWDIKK